MKLKFTAGQLVKMGKFKEAIPIFAIEVGKALDCGRINQNELILLMQDFNFILLNPSSFDEVQSVGNRMLQLEMRIPGYLIPVSKEEFYNNVKLNYETFDPDDQ